MAKIKPRPLRCAWITRHLPTQRQRDSLTGAGYEIFYLPDRDRDARRILASVCNVLRCDPDLIVASLPVATLHYLAQQAPCPVLVADMDKRYDPPAWTGRWQRVICLELRTEPFTLSGRAG